MLLLLLHWQTPLVSNDDDDDDDDDKDDDREEANDIEDCNDVAGGLPRLFALRDACLHGTAQLLLTFLVRDAIVVATSFSFSLFLSPPTRHKPLALIPRPTDTKFAHPT